MSPKMIVCVLPHRALREVLLVKYNNMPDHQAGWFVPHVLLNDKEHPEAAAKRVMQDQFGLSARTLHFSHFESFTGNDGSWHLIFHFKTDLKGSHDPKKSGDVAEMKWFPRSKLPPESEIAHNGWAAQIVEKSLTLE